MEPTYQRTAAKLKAPGRTRGLFLICLLLGIATAMASVLFFWISRGGNGSKHAAAVDPVKPSVRTLVIIVPGTFENSHFWPTLPANNQMTFASELQRAVGNNAEILPFLWDGANNHCSRQIAAESLAKLIDRKAVDFKRICLVGHSHGGNIALLAAGLAKNRIATVVCLATPHVTLQMYRENKTFEVPCYCDWQSRQNVDAIVALYTNRDSVPEFWAALAPGLKDRDVLGLTQTWQEHLQYPRLTSDGIIGHLLGWERLRLHKSLNIADANIEIHSLVTGGIAAQHAALHSVRMGYAIGELLRDGPSFSRLRYLQTLVQPEGEDAGEPRLCAVPRDANARNEKIWRLDEITIHLLSRSKVIAHNLDGTDPSPFVRITSSDGKPLYKSGPAKATYHATWKTQSVLLWAGEKCTMGVWADHKLKAKTALGSRLIIPNPEPPLSFPADPGNGIYFSVELKWTEMHF